MTERVAVVTGATSGLGRFVARGLAEAGFRLVLPVRDEARGAAAAAWVAASCPGAAIELELADLSSLASTRAAAAAITARHPRLHLLANNAGVFRARRSVTAEGRELVLAVNHLAPHLLTQLLLPALLAGAPSRIVLTGSSTSDRAKLDRARLERGQLELGRRWTMVGAYSQSKLAAMMSTFDVARRLAGTGVVANVVHPGMVATGLIRSGGPIGLAWRAMAPWLRTEAQGAETPLHVALAPDLAAQTGRYFKDRVPVAPNRRAMDPMLVEQLVAATDALIGATVANAAAATSER